MSVSFNGKNTESSILLKIFEHYIMTQIIKPLIGKDVIETLTLGMYEDPRFIYREYVQNSADQIDQAIEEKTLKNRAKGLIHIDINKKSKSIVIEDNATGIPYKKVYEILGNVAASTKERGIHKGFRGIGRLGGLGYCEKLIFETTAKGEEQVSIMTWNAKELKKIINDRKLKMEASEVISAITNLSFESTNKSTHYFKVRLEKVTNPVLLDTQTVSDYLSMVAPIPFSPSFYFKDKIKKDLKSYKQSIDEYNVFINQNQLYKSYTTAIYQGNNENNRKTQIDELFDIEFFKKSLNDELLIWGWYGVSEFKSQIPERGNLARGLRLRKGNIQIGSDFTMVKLFREQRGNFYFFGEIHAFSHDLLPNARRDYFVDNGECREMENYLKDLFRNKLQKLYYTASQIRSANKKVLKLKEFKKEYNTKQKEGFSTMEEKLDMEHKFEKIKEEAKKAKQKLEREQEKATEADNEIVSRIIEQVVDTEHITPKNYKITKKQKEREAPLRTDKLDHLSTAERNLLNKIYVIIDKELPPPLAMGLKDKIEKTV